MGHATEAVVPCFPVAYAAEGVRAGRLNRLLYRT
jgi:hypothetical protein